MCVAHYVQLLRKQIEKQHTVDRLEAILTMVYNFYTTIIRFVHSPLTFKWLNLSIEPQGSNVILNLSIPYVFRNHEK